MSDVVDEFPVKEERVSMHLGKPVGRVIYGFKTEEYRDGFSAAHINAYWNRGSK